MLKLLFFKEDLEGVGPLRGFTFWPKVTKTFKNLNKSSRLHSWWINTYLSLSSGSMHSTFWKRTLMNSSGSVGKQDRSKTFILYCMKKPHNFCSPFSSVLKVSQPSCFRKFMTHSAGTKPCLQWMHQLSFSRHTGHYEKGSTLQSSYLRKRLTIVLRVQFRGCCGSAGFWQIRSTTTDELNKLWK